MSETKNYQLYVENDETTKFRDWRQRMNGTEDSNMVKIDTALGEKADKSQPILETLLATGWAGSAAPYTQEIQVPGLDAAQNGSASLAQDATPEQRDAARKAMLTVVGQNDGALTFAADGEKPNIDISVMITLLG